MTYPSHTLDPAPIIDEIRDGARVAWEIPQARKNAAYFADLFSATAQIQRPNGRRSADQISPRKRITKARESEIALAWPARRRKFSRDARSSSITRHSR